MNRNIILKKILCQWPNFLIFLAIIFFLCTHLPYLGNNAPTYSDFTIIRQPVYSIFIWFFHWAGKYQFKYAMWTQGLLTFFALAYARHWLKKNLNLTDISIIPVFLLVLVTISFYYQIISLDDPEGLTFPFFIFTFFNTVECFQQFNLKKIISLAIWVSILVLARTQFYFYYGIFIVLLGWYFWKKIAIKKLFVCAVIFILTILATNLLDRSYHYVMNDSFTTEPFSGLSIIIQPLYLASPDAAKYFTNPKEKAIVQSLLNKINGQKLNSDVKALASTKIQYYEYANQGYTRSYLPIQYSVNKIVTGISFDDIYRVDSAALFSLNKTTLSISKTLFLHNIKENIYLYCYRMIDFMGGIAPFLFFCLLFFIAIIKIFRNRNINDSSITELFVFLILLTTFFNAMIVAVAEPFCARYFCYTQFLLYCFAAYIGESIFLKTKSLKC